MEATRPRRFRIVPGLDEPLGAIPGHRAVPGIDRFLLLGEDDIPGACHIAAQYVTAAYRPGAPWGFADVQIHDCDEVNLLLPSGDRLRYRYEIDGELHQAEGPCAVFIPAGTGHRMEPVEGTGIFVCIRFERGKSRAEPAVGGP